MTEAGKNRIMIFGPKADGTYVVEFRTAEGEVLAISIPRTETAVIRHFQERMPHGLFVPSDEQGIGPIAPDILEGGIDLGAGAGVENLDL